jgi:hypothetical protein
MFFWPSYFFLRAGAIAERAAAQISGITGISDLMTVANHADAGDVRNCIEAAFRPPPR